MIAMGKSTERVGTVRVCITFDSFTSPHGWEVARASVTDVRHGVPVRGDCREPSATGWSSVDFDSNRERAAGTGESPHACRLLPARFSTLTEGDASGARACEGGAPAGQLRADMLSPVSEFYDADESLFNIIGCPLANNKYKKQ